jgi:hypothetical protein
MYPSNWSMPEGSRPQVYLSQLGNVGRSSEETAHGYEKIQCLLSYYLLQSLIL